MNFKQKIKGKKVLIFGLGLQGGGVGDALWLFQNGAAVKVTDLKSKEALSASLSLLPSGIAQSLGGHKREDIDWAELIIKNPGVPDDNELIKYAESRRIPIYTSIAVFVSEARDKSIGITGTRGKSTTTELIYQILDHSYPGQIIRGGNIPGTSGLALLDQLPNSKYAVLELSSFQLHNFHESKISPHLSVMTNFYPDHLNRYASMEAYAMDKAAIFAYQKPSDIAVVNTEDPIGQKLASHSPATLIKFSASQVPLTWRPLIPGRHNLENIAAAMTVARALNIELKQVKKDIESFHGLPFRLQTIAKINGVAYLNDTTSTTPTASVKAIASLTGPTCIIVGGANKNLPYDEFIKALADSKQVKKIIILGSRELTSFVNELRLRAGKKIIDQVYSMKDAVRLSADSTRRGWTVLLSPGFTSFDLFQNEFDRGRQFNQEVALLEAH